MMSLEGISTDANLRQAFYEAGQFDRVRLSHEQMAAADNLAGSQGIATDEPGAALTAVSEEHTAMHPGVAHGDRSRTLRLSEA